MVHSLFLLVLSTYWTIHRTILVLCIPEIAPFSETFGNKKPPCQGGFLRVFLLLLLLLCSSTFHDPQFRLGTITAVFLLELPCHFGKEEKP